VFYYFLLAINYMVALKLINLLINIVLTSNFMKMLYL